MRTRRIVLFAAAFLAVVCAGSLVLVFGYPDFVRTRVFVPTVRAIYAAKRQLDHLPGLTLWFVPLTFLAVLLVRALLRVLTQQELPQRLAPSRWSIVPQAGEVEALTRYLVRARRSRFARARVSRHLKEIATRMISGREGIPPEQARHLLESGYWSEHPVVHEVLAPRKHYAGRQSDVAFERDLQATLEFLETYDQEA